ncbi:MAG: M6 family metalloprotease domain-containing protein [Bacteroidaceae bacterium]|nr:M6 family metalloprotease domain-containing protein [Bacteroidaceae bacterium]
MKRTLITLSLSLVALLAVALPAKRVTRTIRMADGSLREVVLTGNEHRHYWRSAGGEAFLICPDGSLVELTDPEKLVGRELRRQPATRAVDYSQERQDIRGTKKGLVILVQFPDLQFHYTQSDFQLYFNQPNYNQHGMCGSVRDYFLGQSYGQLAIDFDVVGPVTMSKSYTYYGQNGSDDFDKYVGTMVIEAVKQVDADVDFSQYDWNGDGEVDQVFVLYAGYAESAGAPANTIWPHEYELSSAKEYGDGTGAMVCDGVTIDTYACSSELDNTSGFTITGIGSACHEFSHCLGLPDFYDLSGNAYGMQDFSIMDYGCYNGDGRCPAGFTSYERWYCGWMELTELTEATQVSALAPLVDEPCAYVIRNPNRSTEYYLLENRQLTSWDAGLPGHGLLILHVDFLSSAWFNNSVNSSRNHQRMTVVPADGRLDYSTLRQLAGDPWPGTSGATELTDTSTPAATLFNRNTDGTKLLHFPITGIAENTVTGTVSFHAEPLATDVEPVRADAAQTVFDLQGRPACPDFRGIGVSKGRKSVVR